jgi:hypothetical protein
MPRNKKYSTDILFSSLAFAIATLFGWYYSLFQGMRFDLEQKEAPFLTEIVRTISPYMLLLPLILHTLGQYWIKKGDKGDYLRILAHSGYLLAFSWALLVIFAWMLSGITIGSVID